MLKYDQTVITFLDAVAVLLVAAAVTGLLFPVIGWAAPAVAGAGVFTAARASEYLLRRAS